jgi:hypothetical protein
MRKKTAYCTITSANYLGRAQIFADSLERHNPGAKLFILLCEHPDVCKELSEKLQYSFYSPADAGCDDWLQLAFYYNLTEFNTALKPFFLERIIESGYEAVHYFDPDIEIHDSLSEMEDLIPDFDVVLTPHICEPPLKNNRGRQIDQFVHPTEIFIRAGQFNLGYLGISSSRESRELLRWWQQVCKDKCHCQTMGEHFIYFYDQFWASLFPSFIEKTCILRDSSYNVAYWNISQRELKFQDNRWTVDGKALKFFHFSGLVLSPDRNSEYRYRINSSLDPDLHRIISEYVKKLADISWNVCSSYPYSFGRFSNNEILTGPERRAYHIMPAADRIRSGNPFLNVEELRDKGKFDLDVDLMTPEDRCSYFFSCGIFQGMSFLYEEKGLTVSGMGIPEGPYPQWNLPRVRWARCPRATIEFYVINGSKFDSVVLSMSFCPHVRPSARMTVKLNKEVIREYNVAGWDNWQDDKLYLKPQKGRNIIEFSFEDTDDMSSSDDSLYMIFRELLLSGVRKKKKD